ncbi:hypothetical protein NCS57_00232300 [Fusarium keratoplasticum]|uniref:Uncharacterized protein n=1 Tax=Fusarium keratoplasticum TaxID=1328300 RepID=A0ACC0RBL5_9HYPO|nr:hypothetical protein NCS57_00232300 [Fusarium keratoplasticum]KAI8679541.1 hypothetical protein NCS57_00232300 [Fusarium keratoplasticum]
MRPLVTLSLFSGLGLATADVASVRSTKGPSRTIHKDVVVIGGGSSGTFAAVKLRRMGKKVALIEKGDLLGGHTVTYQVPDTNITINYGVVGYGDEQVTRDQFASFDISIVNFPIPEGGFGPTSYVDFSNGRTLKNFNFSMDLSGIREQTDKYPYLYYSTRLPDPVPKDLLLPFRDWVKKYKLEETTYNVFSHLQGLGDLPNLATLYVLKYLNSGYLEVMSPESKGALGPVRGNNYELYEKSHKYLGSDVFVSSTVSEARRDSKGVRLRVKTPDGVVNIRAKKLLITIPPMVRNMEPFGLSDREEDLFCKFTATGWYVGIIRAEGLPGGFSYQNADPDTPWNLPQLPALFEMSPTQAPGLYAVRYSSNEDIADSVVKEDMLRTFDRVRFSVLGNDTQKLEPAELLAYSSHAPFDLHVPIDEIANGFYNKLDDLQGYKSTWYSGATFVSHSTGALWNFTDHLVDKMYE